MKKFKYITTITAFLLLAACEESNETVHGCIDSQACNYNPDANLDNNSCVYAEEGMECGEGCMDESASNFDETASIEGDCCYDCFDASQTLLGNYCGGYNNEDVIEINFSGFFECWTNSSGLVPPYTPGALPYFGSNGQPVMCSWDDFPDYVIGITCY